MHRRDFIKATGLTAGALLINPLSACVPINTRNKMFIDVSDHPSLASAVAEADSLKYQGGSTIYIPGRVAPYIADGLVWPENTAVFGDGNGSKISGVSTCSHVRGTEISNLNFIDGLELVNCRRVDFNNLLFSSDSDDSVHTGLVTISGASYYNVFSRCNWYKVNNALQFIGEVNFNKIKDCEIHHYGTGLEVLPDVDGKLPTGLRVRDTAFEGWTQSGTGIIKPHIILRGKQHRFENNWYEPGGNKTYETYAFIFEQEAAGCEDTNSFRSWQVTFRDRSEGTNKW